MFVNYEERNKKPALLKLPIYSSELALVFFSKITVFSAQKWLQRSHSFMVNVLIWQFHNSSCGFFCYLSFLSRTFTIYKTVWEGGDCLFNSSLSLLPALQALKHKPVTTAESLPLHIPSSQTQTRSLLLPSTS